MTLCEITIQYTDGAKETVETYLDLDLSVEAQVHESFNPLSKDYPQILSFRWREINAPPYVYKPI